MTEGRKNYWVDLAMLLFLLASYITGELTAKVKRGILHLAINYDQMAAIHKAMSVLFVGLVILHLLLHVRWVKSMTASFFYPKARKKEH